VVFKGDRPAAIGSVGPLSSVCFPLRAGREAADDYFQEMVTLARTVEQHDR